MKDEETSFLEEVCLEGEKCTVSGERHGAEGELSFFKGRLEHFGGLRESGSEQGKIREEERDN